ncbi:MAG: hypothetical protein HY814_05685 [Candidatus Riflebacteria bacterium]|nr:hypothetical protein [Candidatus Riflebacteria bacterium]
MSRVAGEAPFITGLLLEEKRFLERGERTVAVATSPCKRETAHSLALSLPPLWLCASVALC